LHTGQLPAAIFYTAENYTWTLNLTVTRYDAYSAEQVMLNKQQI